MRFKCGSCDTEFVVRGVKESVVTCGKCGSPNSIIDETVENDSESRNGDVIQSTDLEIGKRYKIEHPTGTIIVDVESYNAKQGFITIVATSASPYWHQGQYYTIYNKDYKIVADGAGANVNESQSRGVKAKQVLDGIASALSELQNLGLTSITTDLETIRSMLIGVTKKVRNTVESLDISIDVE